MNKSRHSNSRTLQLQVVAGRSQGGTAHLPHRQAVSLGSELDNDIVIFDPESDQWSADIRSNGENALLIVLQGKLRYNGADLTIGKEYLIKPGDVVEAGTSRFAIDDATGRMAVSPRNLSHEAQTAAGQRRSRSALQIPTIATAAALLLFGSSLLYLGINTQSKRNQTNFNANPLSLTFEERFNLLALPGLSYEPADVNRNARVHGQVASRADKLRLEQMARETNTAVDFNIQINDALKETIHDVYRVNGVAADIEVKGTGKAVVSTSTADTDKLQQIESMLRRDLVNLIDLQVNNTPPKVIKQGSTALDRNKQITMIVAGDDGYLVTRDTSRYFIGSLMPNGYVVERIREGDVTVSRDGETVTLKF